MLRLRAVDQGSTDLQLPAARLMPFVCFRTSAGWRLRPAVGTAQRGQALALSRAMSARRLSCTSAVFSSIPVRRRATASSSSSGLRVVLISAGAGVGRHRGRPSHSCAALRQERSAGGTDRMGAGERPEPDEGCRVRSSPDKARGTRGVAGADRRVVDAALWAFVYERFPGERQVQLPRHWTLSQAQGTERLAVRVQPNVNDPAPSREFRALMPCADAARRSSP